MYGVLRKQFYIHPILTFALAYFLAGCGSGAGMGGFPASGMPSLGLLADLGSPPQGPHIAAATLSISGSSFEDSGGNIAAEPPSVTVDATAAAYSWVRYAFGMPAGGTLNNVRVGVESVLGEFWVALSDYSGAGSWTWYGPYSDIAVVAPAGNPGDCLSLTNNLYWVVVAPHG